MTTTVMESIITDLLSINPMIRRLTRRKLLKTAFLQVEADIGLPHLEVMHLLQIEGTRHIAEIGEKLLIPKPQMTHIIDRLEHLDIARRQPDAGDRRITNIALTDKGYTICNEIDEILTSSITESLSILSEKELKDLSASLRRLNDIFSKLV